MNKPEHTDEMITFSDGNRVPRSVLECMYQDYKQINTIKDVSDSSSDNIYFAKLETYVWLNFAQKWGRFATTRCFAIIELWFIVFLSTLAMLMFSMGNVVSLVDYVLPVIAFIGVISSGNSLFRSLKSAERTMGMFKEINAYKMFFERKE